MKRKLFRKNLYSFSKQGLAENLLPVSKEFKKKLVKNPLSVESISDREVKSNLDRNFSADTVQSIRSKLPYYPLNPSKRVQKGKARLLSQFFKQGETPVQLNINIRQSAKPLSLASSNNSRVSMQSFKVLRKSALDLLKIDGHILNTFQVKKQQKNNQNLAIWNLPPQKQNISRVNLLLSAEQVKTEIQSPAFSNTKQKKEYTPFLNQIRESKKLRYLYGNLSATQLKKIARKAQQLPGTTADNLLILLESRLDSVCQRCRFFATIKSARQYIAHKGVWVNSLLVTTPSYQLFPGDVIRLIDPNKLESPFFSLPLKNWKEMCKSSDNILKVSIPQISENFMEFIKNQSQNSLSALDASAIQLLASRFLHKNKLYWQADTSDKIVSTSSHLSKNTENVTNYEETIYKKWILFSLFTTTLTSSSDILFNKSIPSSQKQIESIAFLLNNLNCIRFVSAIVNNLPTRLQQSSNKSLEFQKIATPGAKTTFLQENHRGAEKLISQGKVNKTLLTQRYGQKNNESVVSPKSQQPENQIRKNLLISSTEKTQDINLTTESREVWLKNNSIKKIFFDFAPLLHLELESLLISSQAQQKNLVMLNKSLADLLKKKIENNFYIKPNIRFGIVNLLQVFLAVNKTEILVDNLKKENLAQKEFPNQSTLHKESIISTKKFLIWAQKLSAFFLKKIQATTTQSHLSASNKMGKICSSPHFSKYLVSIFFLYMQNRFFKRYSRRVRNLTTNTFSSSTSQISIPLERIKKTSAFYQKKSKPLHLEVSYQSLSAIFLFPPQKIYLSAIIDLHTIVKTTLK